MWKRSLLLIQVVFLSLCSHAEVRNSSFLFDAPTAYINKGIFYEGTIATTFTGTDDPYPIDTDLHFMASLFGKLELTLSFLTFSDLRISPSIKYNIVSESEKIPAVSVGVLNLFTSKYISSVGGSKNTVWSDDSSYIPEYIRCPEHNSLFLVFTKDMGAWGRYNMGFGRGCFVGYGPRSRQFNTDRFYHWSDTHSDAIGMFWGVDIELGYNIRGGFEFDGRDFNIGLKFKKEGFEVSFLAAKLEHRLGGSPNFTPRIDLSTTFNSYFLRRMPSPPKVGAITGDVVDRNSKIPIGATITVKGAEIPSITTDAEGRYAVTIAPGSYLVRAEAEGYYWMEKKVYVRERMQTICNFELKKK